MSTDLPLHHCSPCRVALQLLLQLYTTHLLTRPLSYLLIDAVKRVIPNMTHPLSHPSSITCTSLRLNECTHIPTQHKVPSALPHSNENPITMATVPRFEYIRQCEEALLLNLTPQTPPNDANGHHINDDRVDKCRQGVYVFADSILYATAMDGFENGRMGSSATRVMANKVSPPLLVPSTLYTSTTPQNHAPSYPSLENASKAFLRRLGCRHHHRRQVGCSDDGLDWV